MGCDLGWADCLNQDFQDGRGFSIRGFSGWQRIFRIAGDRSSADREIHEGARSRTKRDWQYGWRWRGCCSADLFRCLNQDCCSTASMPLMPSAVPFLTNPSSMPPCRLFGSQPHCGDDGILAAGRTGCEAGRYRGALRGESPRTREGRRPDRPNWHSPWRRLRSGDRQP